ncbi:hypothetical protein BME13_16235 [Klebsiella pneumoniae]|nr:hypothetical protein [Klebsiella pneumoniae]PDP94440.1 hypothetical protein CGQ19_23490 [Klebsiella quasipneumoniae]OVU53301.1 hypothetical protein BME13_16235 [Klebsiella pneumoniae]OVX87592.1 hypothetical protein BME20_05810 [Klebsiella pneumoniae]OXU49596.1 hypothetical protein BME35_15980 [Klebsiella pneumoniae]
MQYRIIPAMPTCLSNIQLEASIDYIFFAGWKVKGKLIFMRIIISFLNRFSIISDTITNCTKPLHI